MFVRVHLRTNVSMNAFTNNAVKQTRSAQEISCSTPEQWIFSHARLPILNCALDTDWGASELGDADSCARYPRFRTQQSEVRK